MPGERVGRRGYTRRPVSTRSLESQKRRQLSRFERSVEAVQAAVRRESGGAEAIGQRAARTRQRVLDAAEALFGEKGYSAVAVNEIAVAAEVRLPTLYQYFSGKSGIFAVLVGERAIEMMAQGVDEWDPASGVVGLHRVIHEFVATYAKNATFFRAWEDATQAEPSIASLRREWNMVYKLRVAEAIRMGQTSGVVGSGDDPHELARWLTRGLESYCFDVLVFDQPSRKYSVEQIADALTDIWAATLQLSPAADA
jgi:AcrR family transcriptional regulator